MHVVKPNIKIKPSKHRIVNNYKTNNTNIDLNYIKHTGWKSQHAENENSGCRLRYLFVSSTFLECTVCCLFHPYLRFFCAGNHCEWESHTVITTYPPRFCGLLFNNNGSCRIRKIFLWVVLCFVRTGFGCLFVVCVNIWTILDYT